MSRFAILGTRSDHPRMRGEDEDTVLYRNMEAGSPPHARGRLLRGVLSDVGGGITPACAGKTPPPPGQTSQEQDHPRMRGEDASMFCIDAELLGSPPHARGRLQRLSP